MGPTLDPKWPFVSRVAWKHDAPNPRAILGRLTVTFSTDMDSSLSPASAQSLIDVYFETAPTTTVTTPGVPPVTAVMPGQMIVLHGTVEVAATNALNWRLRDVDQQGILKGPGRILVRIRCGYLVDKDGRVYSAATDTLLGRATPHVPGGILESWFTIGG